VSTSSPPAPATRPTPLAEPLAFAASTAFVATVDAALGVERSIAALLVALALGGGLGAFVGALFRLLARTPAWLAAAVGAGAGSLLAYRAVVDLNAISRLDSPDKNAALGALAACVAVAVGFMLLVTWASTEGRVARLSLRATRRRRTVAAVVLSGAALGATAFDRLSFPTSYPAAHQVAQTIALVLFGLAASLALELALRDWRHRRRALAAVSVAALLPVALVGERAEKTSRVLLDRPFSRLILITLRDAVDVDRDGYASRLGGGDCAAFNPHVHPGLPEVPHDGVDQNCLLDDDAHAPERAPQLAAPTARAGERPSVVLITVDSQRPDRMSLSGAEHATTPNIDAWAASATRFDRAYTVGGWTSIALSSMVRGTWARQLAWTMLHETNRMRLLRPAETAKLGAREIVAKTFAMPLDDPHPTIATVLDGQGYATAAVLDDGFTGYFRKDLGGFPGFAKYRLTDERRPADRNDAGTTDIALSVTKQLARSRQPFFVWVHYFGPHAPSQKHAGTPDFGGGVTGAYDHEIAFADAQIGRYLEYLDALGRERPVAVLLTADHGEEITARSRAHGLSLDEEALRIPLVARLPGLEPGACGELASLADIAVTVADLAGAPAPDSFVGRDLRGVCADGAPPRTVFADTWRFDHLGRVYFDGAAAIDQRAKATLSFGDMRRGELSLAHGQPVPLEEGDPAAADVRAALDGYADTYGAIVLGE
jgi:arylsulfatase A-like enzyme